MVHMEEILRALLRRALSEQGGEPRALTGITIESGWRRFEPRVCAEFSDGHRVWHSLTPSACFAFCERHGVWDIAALRGLLLQDTRRIYAQMLREQRARRADPPRTWFGALVRRLRAGLWRGRRHGRQLPAIEAAFRRHFFEESGEAWERGLQLLEEHLSPEQRRQYDASGYFDVTGGASGRRYRIRQGSSMNIEQLDKKGRRVCTLCFMPTGRLVTGDVMLAQKVALEAFERDALKIANKFY
jgi:hypothetical protein